MQDRIAVFTTGGTIDKDYGIGSGVRDLEVGPAVAGRIFDFMQLGESVHLCKLGFMSKDSLDMTDEDRERIARECLNSSYQTIIITHGTDTMRETARTIQESGIGPHKLIILTGALKPYSMKDSDAMGNLMLALGFAIANSHRGIYIAMNGIHHWDQCYKDPARGTFREIHGE
jgi:L-asparaginase